MLPYLFPVEAISSKLHGRPSKPMYYSAKAVLNLTATYFGVPKMFFPYVESYELCHRNVSWCFRCQAWWWKHNEWPTAGLDAKQVQLKKQHFDTLFVDATCMKTTATVCCSDLFRLSLHKGCWMCGHDCNKCIQGLHVVGTHSEPACSISGATLLWPAWLQGCPP